LYGSVNECFHSSPDEGLVYPKACLLLAAVVIAPKISLDFMWIVESNNNKKAIKVSKREA